MRLMLLDKRVFQHQRFKFRIDHDNVEVRDLFHHSLHLWKMAAPKIARDPVFELFGLTHIYDFAR